MSYQYPLTLIHDVLTEQGKILNQGETVGYLGHKLGGYIEVEFYRKGNRYTTALNPNNTKELANAIRS